MTDTDRYKILVLDDEDMLRQTVCDYLEDEGHEAVQASSAEEALELLKTEKFDFCTVDMRLPGMDGNDFIIQANKENVQLKFLIYTGSTDYQLPQYLSKIGIEKSQVFQKPLKDLSILSEAIKEIMNRSK